MVRLRGLQQVIFKARRRADMGLDPTSFLAGAVPGGLCALFVVLVFKAGQMRAAREDARTRSLVASVFTAPFPLWPGKSIQVDDGLYRHEFLIRSAQPDLGRAELDWLAHYDLYSACSDCGTSVHIDDLRFRAAGGGDGVASVSATTMVLEYFGSPRVRVCASCKEKVERDPAFSDVV